MLNVLFKAIYRSEFDKVPEGAYRHSENTQIEHASVVRGSGGATERAQVEHMIIFGGKRLLVILAPLKNF